MVTVQITDPLMLGTEFSGFMKTAGIGVMPMMRNNAMGFGPLCSKPMVVEPFIDISEPLSKDEFVSRMPFEYAADGDGFEEDRSAADIYYKTHRDVLVSKWWRMQQYVNRMWERVGSTPERTVADYANQEHRFASNCERDREYDRAAWLYFKAAINLHGVAGMEGALRVFDRMEDAAGNFMQSGVVSHLASAAIVRENSHRLLAARDEATGSKFFLSERVRQDAAESWAVFLKMVHGSPDLFEFALERGLSLAWNSYSNSHEFDDSPGEKVKIGLRFGNFKMPYVSRREAVSDIITDILAESSSFYGARNDYERSSEDMLRVVWLMFEGEVGADELMEAANLMRSAEMMIGAQMAGENVAKLNRLADAAEQLAEAG